LKSYTINLVPKVTLCKKLNDLGFSYSNDNYFYWINIGENKWNLIYDTVDLIDIENKAKEIVRAPTLTEILELIPNEINNHTDGEEIFTIQKILDNEIYWVAQYIYYSYLSPDFRPTISFKNKSLPNAAASLLIWLVENNYVKFEY